MTPNDLNFSSKFFLFKNELSLGFMHSEYGKHTEPSTAPLLTPGLGSLTFPSKRSLLLASISLNSFFLIFYSICALILIICLFSLAKYFDCLIFVSLLVTFLFSNFHFFRPPSKTKTRLGLCPKYKN